MASQQTNKKKELAKTTSFVEPGDNASFARRGNAQPPLPGSTATSRDKFSADDDGEVLLIRSKLGAAVAQQQQQLQLQQSSQPGAAKLSYVVSDPSNTIQSAVTTVSPAFPDSSDHQHSHFPSVSSSTSSPSSAGRSISPGTAALLSDVNRGHMEAIRRNSVGDGGASQKNPGAAATTAVDATAASSSSSPSSAFTQPPSFLDLDAGLPALSDVVFAPEKVSHHTFFNSWIVEDETRNFAFLRKEKKAVVTFQCRIIVKGAKHIQMQIAAGPNVDFLLPTWLLIRYVQSELLPPCLLEDYNLVEKWMSCFIQEVKNISTKTATAMAMGSKEDEMILNRSGETREYSVRMTRHLVHAAAAMVNAQDLFMGLISHYKDEAAGAGGGGSGGGNGSFFLMSGNSTSGSKGRDDDDDHLPSAAAAAAATHLPGARRKDQQHHHDEEHKPSLFTRLFGELKGTTELMRDKQERRNAAAGGIDSSSSAPGSPALPQQQQEHSELSPAQHQILDNAKLFTLVPAAYRAPPNPLTWKSGAKWLLDAAQATIRANTKDDYRARFFLPRPQTKDEWRLQEVLREQAKANRRDMAMVVMFLFLTICRFVSFDLFLILAGFVLYGTRYIFTEYKNIFIFFTKRTARSRVNRVKDWFTFGVRRKNAIEGASDAQTAAAAAVTAAHEQADIDFDDWDFDD